MSIENDVTDFLSDGTTPVVEETPTETEETHGKEEQESETPSEQAAEPEDSASGEEVEAEEETTTETADDGTQGDGESLEETNKRLIARIEELSAKIGIPAPKEQKKEEIPPETTEEVKDAIQKFIGDDVDLDALLEDRNALNSVLVAVHKNAVEEATKRVLLSLPKVVTSYLTRHTTNKEIVDNFYAQNQDLSNVKATVRAVAIDLQQENPDWDASKLLDESAKKTREILGLKKRAETQEKPKGSNGPAFASSGKGHRPSVPKESKLQKQISDLISD